MKYENNIYDELKEYVKVNMGFGKALFETDLYKRYKEQMNFIKDNFNNKKVCLVGVGGSEFFKSTRRLTGKIKIEEKDKGGFEIKFYEGRKRTKYNILDLGLFEGFYAVVIIKEIEVLK